VGETATDTAVVRVYDIDELFVTINDANTFAGVETLFAASIKGGSSLILLAGISEMDQQARKQPTHMYSILGNTL